MVVLSPQPVGYAVPLVSGEEDFTQVQEGQGGGGDDGTMYCTYLVWYLDGREVYRELIGCQ